VVAGWKMNRFCGARKSAALLGARTHRDPLPGEGRGDRSRRFEALVSP